MNPPLIFLPGLGGNERMFFRQMPDFPDAQALNFMPHQGREDLASYCARWAQSGDFPQGSLLVGVSMGGFMALELAKHLNSPAVILVASCRRFFWPHLRYRMLEPFAQWVPDQFRQSISAWTARHLMKRLENGWDASVEENFLDMLEEKNHAFFRWSAHAAAVYIAQRRWDLPSSQIFQIHGSKDHVISYQADELDQLIEGGGHLINMTHAPAVNHFIKNCLRSLNQV